MNDASLPERPPRDLADFGDLTPAEQMLRDGVGTGEFVDVNHGRGRPGPDAGRELWIRASFLRSLILGGCGALPAPLHEKGVRLAGARIRGKLDLQGCDIASEIALFACHFDETPNLRSARIGGLWLNRSALPGLSADRLCARANVSVQGAKVTGTLRLGGAKLGGGLSCTGAELDAGRDGVALGADRLSADGSVVLRQVTATGTLRLLGAKLGGSLACEGAELDAGRDGDALGADGLSADGAVFLSQVKATGTLRLAGAKLGGDLDCVGAVLDAGPQRHALLTDNADVTGALFLRDCRISGGVSFGSTRVGTLIDTPESWPRTGLFLDRFTYGAIAGDGTRTDAASRIDWLKRQRQIDLTTEFKPQPWEHCARVLREMGHAEAARKVLIEKERLQRKARLAHIRRNGPREDVPLVRLLDTLLGVTVCYGRRPLLAFAWLFGFWIVGAVLFQVAYGNDAFKPNNPVVLRAPEWVLCGYPDTEWVDLAAVAKPRPGRAQSGQSQLACFKAQPEAARYPQFNGLIYSADTLLPVVSLEMQEFWIPDDRVIPAGKWARVYLWVHIAVGWALSLLAVAGFSGLIRSD
jgi:hypothetical protein